MFQHLTLNNPLAILDLETTGINTQQDRVVEISVLKVFLDGSHESKTRRLNPCMPIPARASEVHGISDADVQNEAKFGDIANSLLGYLEGCDLCGYNAKRFDLKMLEAEFKRAGKCFAPQSHCIIDPLEIFQRYEPGPWKLTSAVQFYLGRDHTTAHSAAGDVQATAEVLDAMVGRYTDLPKNIQAITKQLRNSCDPDGFFRQTGGEIRFVKGKHRGVNIEFVAQNEPSYLNWMLGENFAIETKALIRHALGI